MRSNLYGQSADPADTPNVGYTESRTGSASRVADLQLWRDWCAAASLDPETVTSGDITDFVAATSRSRSLQYRRAAAVRAALGLPAPAPVRVHRFHPARILAGLPRVGWPAGLNRRRDAFIVVAASLGLTRRRIQQLAPDDIDISGARPQINGLVVPVDPDPSRCGACAVIDWLTIAGATVGGGRGEAQQLMLQLPASVHRHQPPDSRWRASQQLLPPIDVHGWPDHSAAVSLRTITAAVNRPPQPIPALPTPAAAHVSASRIQASTDELLDALDAAADTAFDKVSAVMAALGLEPDRPAS